MSSNASKWRDKAAENVARGYNVKFLKPNLYAGTFRDATSDTQLASAADHDFRWSFAAVGACVLRRDRE